MKNKFLLHLFLLTLIVMFSKYAFAGSFDCDKVISPLTYCQNTPEINGEACMLLSANLPYGKPYSEQKAWYETHTQDTDGDYICGLADCDSNNSDIGISPVIKGMVIEYDPQYLRDVKENDHFDPRSRSAAPELSGLFTPFDAIQISIDVSCNKKQSGSLQFYIWYSADDENITSKTLATFTAEPGTIDKFGNHKYTLTNPQIEYTPDSRWPGISLYDSNLKSTNEINKLIDAIANEKEIRLNLEYINVWPKYSTMLNPYDIDEDNTIANIWLITPPGPAGQVTALSHLMDVSPDKPIEKFIISKVIPTTSCYQLYGDGKIKVVSMRSNVTNSLLITAKDIVSLAEGVRENGFEKIDPFKTYKENFSHFVDLKYHQNLTWRWNTLIKSQSSCKNAEIYTLYSYDPFISYYGGAVALLGQGVAGAYPSMPPNVIIHETGHSFCNLRDEYVLPGMLGIGYLWQPRTNCVENPSSSYRNPSDNVIYGGVVYTGCTRLKSTSAGNPNTFIYYHRPSETSIMKDGYNQNKFNIISCGYCLSKLNGKRASSNWPECKNLNTMKTI